MGNIYRSDIKGGVTPSGTKPITISAPGTTTHDVAGFANAEVTTSGLVPTPSGIRDDTGTPITVNGDKTITELDNYTGVKVNVNVASPISVTQLIATNITSLYPLTISQSTIDKVMGGAIIQLVGDAASTSGSATGEIAFQKTTGIEGETRITSSNINDYLSNSTPKTITAMLNSINMQMRIKILLFSTT